MSSIPQRTDANKESLGQKPIPTIEDFYKFCRDRKLMGVKCSKCGTTFALPRPTCPKCHSSKMDWFELKGTGKLLSYSIVHVSTTEYQNQTPYVVGIVEFDEGPRLSGVIREIKHEDLKIGLNVVIDFEDNQTQDWPQWPKYFFRSTQKESV